MWEPLLEDFLSVSYSINSWLVSLYMYLACGERFYLITTDFLVHVTLWLEGLSLPVIPSRVQLMIKG